MLEVELASNFSRASRNWVTRFNHNHLRITRIIRSLRVLGLEEEAIAFFSALKNVQASSNISSKSLIFWTKAAERPLYIAPEDEEDDGTADEYLYEYEENKEAGKESGGGSGSLEIPVHDYRETTMPSTSNGSAETSEKFENNPSMKRKLEDADEVAR